MIQVILPGHLRTLAGVKGEVWLEIPPPVTAAAILSGLEARFPPLLGTMRDAQTGARRAYVRFYACEEDLSQNPVDAPLPAAVAEGREPFWIVGAIAGG
ncbi:MAG: MoaD/ThiS family protein [Terriglobales bacterium]